MTLLLGTNTIGAELLFYFGIETMTRHGSLWKWSKTEGDGWLASIRLEEGYEYPQDDGHRTQNSPASASSKAGSI